MSLKENHFSHDKRQRFKTLPFLLLFTGLFFAGPANASDYRPPLTGELMQKWYNLGHYDKNGRSEITNREFFISSEGQNNPQAEYDAFVDLLSSYKHKKTGKEILCKFPARMTLMEQTLGWFNRNDRPKCDEYSDVVNPEEIKSVSLIFASGYFNNPASYYGHTLLRFNYNDTALNQKLLDASLNYGADATNNEGTVLYILNGIFGGYGASYQRNNDFIHSNRYTNGQLRDLWEYELNLTQEQIKFVAEHSWELKFAKFRYYFFNDNCAHRIINPVERAINADLTDSHGFWLLPVQVIRAAGDYNNGGVNLIKNEKYRPSLKSSFSQRYRNLSEEQKDGFIKFFDAKPDKREKIASELPENVLFLILEQLDIQAAKLTIEEENDNEKKKEIDGRRRIVLFELLKRPPVQNRDELRWDKNNTLMNYKKASVVRLGHTQRNSDEMVSAKYQIANNDLLDTPMAGQEYSRFIMGSVDADIKENDFKIRDITAVDVTNLNTNPLPLHLTGEYSWQVKIGYNQRNRVCDGCASFGVTGKVGKAVRINDVTLLYSLVGGRVNHKRTDGYRYVTGISESGVLFDMKENGKINLGFDVSADAVNGNPEYIGKSDYVINLSSRSDLRIGAETDFKGRNAVTVQIGYFFD